MDNLWAYLMKAGVNGEIASIEKTQEPLFHYAHPSLHILFQLLSRGELSHSSDQDQCLLRFFGVLPAFQLYTLLSHSWTCPSVQLGELVSSTLTKVLL